MLRAPLTPTRRLTNVDGRLQGCTPSPKPPRAPATIVLGYKPVTTHNSPKVRVGRPASGAIIGETVIQALSTSRKSKAPASPISSQSALDDSNSSILSSLSDSSSHFAGTLGREARPSDRPDHSKHEASSSSDSLGVLSLSETADKDLRPVVPVTDRLIPPLPETAEQPLTTCAPTQALESTGSGQTGNGGRREQSERLEPPVSQAAALSARPQPHPSHGASALMGPVTVSEASSAAAIATSREVTAALRSQREAMAAAVWAEANLHRRQSLASASAASTLEAGAGSATAPEARLAAALGSADETARRLARLLRVQQQGWDADSCARASSVTVTAARQAPAAPATAQQLQSRPATHGKELQYGDFSEARQSAKVLSHLQQPFAHATGKGSNCDDEVSAIATLLHDADTDINVPHAAGGAYGNTRSLVTRLPAAAAPPQAPPPSSFFRQQHHMLPRQRDESQRLQPPLAPQQTSSSVLQARPPLPKPPRRASSRASSVGTPSRSSSSERLAAALNSSSNSQNHGGSEARNGSTTSGGLASSAMSSYAASIAARLRAARAPTVPSSCPPVALLPSHVGPVQKDQSTRASGRAASLSLGPEGAAAVATILNDQSHRASIAAPRASELQHRELDGSHLPHHRSRSASVAAALLNGDIPVAQSRRPSRLASDQYWLSTNGAYDLGGGELEGLECAIDTLRDHDDEDGIVFGGRYPLRQQSDRQIRSQAQRGRQMPSDKAAPVATSGAWHERLYDRSKSRDQALPARRVADVRASRAPDPALAPRGRSHTNRREYSSARAPPATSRSRNPSAAAALRRRSEVAAQAMFARLEAARREKEVLRNPPLPRATRQRLAGPVDCSPRRTGPTHGKPVSSRIHHGRADRLAALARPRSAPPANSKISAAMGAGNRYSSHARATAAGRSMGGSRAASSPPGGARRTALTVERKARLQQLEDRMMAEQRRRREQQRLRKGMMAAPPHAAGFIPMSLYASSASMFLGPAAPGAAGPARLVGSGSCKRGSWR